MLPNGGGESQRQNASDSTAATAGMGCCNGKAITERVADAYQRKAQAAASLKDDFAEYNLARRAKGLALDDSIMANKETLMKLEDAMDAAILLYSLWAGHKSDYLQVPSLAVWVKSSDDPAKFMGGAAAASAIEEVATQQVQLAALQAAWRRVVSAACVNEMADAKKAFRGGNALANAYIEAEVKAAAAAKKHTAAIAAESKASAEVEAASAKVRELANQASGGPSAEPNKEEQALTRALAAKQEALAKPSAAAVAPKAAAEAAAAELAAAKEEASAGTKAALELGEEATAAAFTALRRGYDEYAHSASGLLSSPDLQDSIALYKPTDDGAAAAAAAAAGTVEAEAAQAEGSEQAAHARVASLLVGIDMAERGVSKAIAALRAGSGSTATPRSSAPRRWTRRMCTAGRRGCWVR